MKRYYTIDTTARKYAKLSSKEWEILENIHFLQSENGYCYSTKLRLSKHHEISYRMYRKYIAKMIDKKWLIQTEKGHLKTTKKWAFLQSEDGKKEAEIDMNKSSCEHKSDMNKSSCFHEQKFMSDMNKSSCLSIKTEYKDRDRERGETKNSFKKSRITDKNYKLLFTKLREKVDKKSKLSERYNTQETYEAYLRIKDKSNLVEDYLAHELEKGQYSQNIYNFLLDYKNEITEIPDGYAYDEKNKRLIKLEKGHYWCDVEDKQKPLYLLDFNQN